MHTYITSCAPRASAQVMSTLCMFDRVHRWLSPHYISGYTYEDIMDSLYV